jgi:hypothetical protein
MKKFPTFYWYLFRLLVLTVLKEVASYAIKCRVSKWDEFQKQSDWTCVHSLTFCSQVKVMTLKWADSNAVTLGLHVAYGIASTDGWLQCCDALDNTIRWREQETWESSRNERLFQFIMKVWSMQYPSCSLVMSCPDCCIQKHKRHREGHKFCKPSALL